MARAGHGLVTRERLGTLEQAEEMLLMGLRLSEGMDVQSLADRTGYTIAADVRQLLERDGLLTSAGPGGTLTATPQGRLLLNSLIAHLAAGLVPADAIAGPPVAEARLNC